MTGRRARRAGRWALLVAALAVVVPSPTVQPARLSLTTVETAKAVDFDDGVLWVLVLGSEAGADEDVTEGRTDAIELLGIDWRSGSAVAIGVPRDSWRDLPGVGRGRINIALAEGGTTLAARAVADLVGITPDLVLVTGFDGFTAMMEEVGDVVVDAPYAFTNDELGLTVRRGPNTLDPDQALDYARTRRALPDSDFGRAANHQRLLLAVLRAVRAREDEAGFLERAALSALGGLETDLSPTEVYRFVQAVTLVDPSRTTGCVIGGTPAVRFGADVVLADEAQARALGDDARDDARLQGGCRG